jgi:hypothetical protein
LLATRAEALDPLDRPRDVTQEVDAERPSSHPPIRALSAVPNLNR